MYLQSRNKTLSSAVENAHVCWRLVGDVYKTCTTDAVIVDPVRNPSALRVKRERVRYAVRTQHCTSNANSSITLLRCCVAAPESRLGASPQNLHSVCKALRIHTHSGPQSPCLLTHSSRQFRQQVVDDDKMQTNNMQTLSKVRANVQDEKTLECCSGKHLCCSNIYLTGCRLSIDLPSASPPVAAS